MAVFSEGLARVALMAATAVALTVGAAVLSLTHGDAVVSLPQLAALLWRPDDSAAGFVLWELRLPRLLAGILVGAALGMAGAIAQSVTRNPLASPDLLGVSAGAALTIVVATIWLPLSVAGMVLAGIGGGLLAALMTMLIAWRARLDPIQLTLAGMSVAILCSAAIMVVLVVAANEANGLYFWLIGGLADRTSAHLAQLFPWVALGLVLGLLFSRPLNVLMLDDAVCQALGVKVLTWRVLAGLAAVILTAASVAVAGPIGFIGLMVPHIVRLSVGHAASDHRVLLPLAALVGAALLASADVVATRQDIPVGILMVVLGGPLFLYLIGRRVR